MRAQRVARAGDRGGVLLGVAPRDLERVARAPARTARYRNLQRLRRRRRIDVDRRAPGEADVARGIDNLARDIMGTVGKPSGGNLDHGRAVCAGDLLSEAACPALPA